MPHLFSRKLSPPWGWGKRPHHCPSGQWHICQTRLDLGYWLGSSMIYSTVQILTWDDYVLPIYARSSKLAKERTSRKHFAGRGWELVCDADINVFRSVSTAILSVEDLHPFDCDCGAIIDGKPWWTSSIGVAYAVCVVDAICCWEAKDIGW